MWDGIGLTGKWDGLSKQLSPHSAAVCHITIHHSPFTTICSTPSFHTMVHFVGLTVTTGGMEH